MPKNGPVGPDLEKEIAPRRQHVSPLCFAPWKMFSGLQVEFWAKLLTWEWQVKRSGVGAPRSHAAAGCIGVVRHRSSYGSATFSKGFSRQRCPRHRKAHAWDLPRFRRLW